MTRLTILFPIACLPLIAGCMPMGAHTNGVAREVPVSQAVLPTVVQPYAPIEQMLMCIRGTHVLRGKTFVVGAFADSTGKINASAPGSTGNFVPQGGSAAYLTDALTKAGASVVSTYFGQPAEAVPAQYAINGIFNSLDFGTPMQADIRVGGIGPTAQVGWAQLSLSIQLDANATRINRQISLIQRPVRYSQLGMGMGRDFNGALATGNIALVNQERLQFEAINGPIALGVIDVVLKEFPKAKSICGGLLRDQLTIADDGPRATSSLSAAAPPLAPSTASPGPVIADAAKKAQQPNVRAAERAPAFEVDYREPSARVPVAQPAPRPEQAREAPARLPTPAANVKQAPARPTASAPAPTPAAWSQPGNIPALGLSWPDAPTKSSIPVKEMPTAETAASGASQKREAPLRLEAPAEQRRETHNSRDQREKTADNWSALSPATSDRVPHRMASPPAPAWSPFSAEAAELATPLRAPRVEDKSPSRSREAQ